MASVHHSTNIVVLPGTTCLSQTKPSKKKIIKMSKQAFRLIQQKYDCVECVLLAGPVAAGSIIMKSDLQG